MGLLKRIATHTFIRRADFYGLLNEHQVRGMDQHSQHAGHVAHGISGQVTSTCWVDFADEMEREHRFGGGRYLRKRHQCTAPHICHVHPKACHAYLLIDFSAKLLHVFYFPVHPRPKSTHSPPFGNDTVRSAAETAQTQRLWVPSASTGAGQLVLLGLPGFQPQIFFPPS